MPRESNTNFLLKARILHAKPEDTLPCIPQLVPLSLPLAKHTLTIAPHPQFHSQSPIQEDVVMVAEKTARWNDADELRLC